MQISCNNENMKHYKDNMSSHIDTDVYCYLYSCDLYTVSYTLQVLITFIS